MTERTEHGGLLIIYAKKFINNNRIVSNGSSGATVESLSNGGGSGAGSINIFYQQKGSIGNIECIGGKGGGNDNSAYPGGNGGNGSVTYGKISSGTFTIFDKGDGTENNPYLIEDETMLRRLASSVVGNNTYEGKYLKLGADIEISEAKEWTPIGNDKTNFKGSFDGDGKTIKGININNSLNNQGLFGIIGDTGTVKNIIAEGSINASLNSGGICATNYGNIKRCKNKITVVASGGYGAGGITARNEGIIDECCNLSNISILKDYDSVGGIAGYNLGIIKKCYNTGTISVPTYAVGGIAGHNSINGISGYIYNCYNNANVTGGIANYNGGIVGGWGYKSGNAYIYNSYTLKNTLIHSSIGNYKDSNYTGTMDMRNCYTTEANIKIEELNAGIDEVDGTDTERPWVEDTNGINGGYPILYWQLEF